MKIDSVATGQATASIEIGGDHMNPFGVAHGAVVFAMIDTSMGKAATSVLRDGQLCATTDIHIRFLRPMAGGPVLATTSVIRQGRTLIHLESRVTDATDRLLATATGAFAVTAA